MPKPKKEQPPTPFARATARAVKTRIEQLGVSNAAFARKTGLSQNYLNERLREEKSFTLSDVDAIATYFGLTPDEFMGTIESANQPALNAQSIDVRRDGDTAGIDELPVLTTAELAQRDLDLAALRDQETPHGDDARTRP